MRTREGFSDCAEASGGHSSETPRPCHLSSTAVRDGRLGSYRRLFAPHLLEVQVTLEMWKPGSYVPGWVGEKQQVPLWLDIEGDFLVQERWQRLLGA